MKHVLAGKVAIITGGGTGIGEACARLFTRDGASVAVMGRRPTPLKKIASEIGCLALPGDASIETDCKTVVQAVIKAFGRLDILVCSAGIMCEGSVTDMDTGDWSRVMDANLNAIMQISRAAIPAMLKDSGGSIVNVASLGAMVAPGNMAAYVTSKTALIGLTRSMAVDYGPRNIRVNTVCPGWVLTPMTEDEMAHYAKMKNVPTETAIAYATRHLPLKRMAQPAEIANCIRFLASNDASFVTGATLVADGGSSAVDVGYISLKS